MKMTTAAIMIVYTYRSHHRIRGYQKQTHYCIFQVYCSKKKESKTTCKRDSKQASKRREKKKQYK